MMGCRWRLVLVTLFFTSFYLYHVQAEKCLQDVPEIRTKMNMRVQHSNITTSKIVLDVSRRITHQITSYIFKIFLEEELGYQDVVIEEHNDRFDDTPLMTLKRMSTDDMGRPPKVTLSTEVWTAPGKEILSWADESTMHIKQCGLVGPFGRFGWFIPKTLLNNNNTYWTIFTSPDSAEEFHFTEDDMNFLQDKLTDDLTAKYFCSKVTNCTNGIYTPPQCRNSPCALLIADYEDSTGFVVQHIMQLGLFVRVAWVGPHLSEVVDYITQRHANTPYSLVFLTHTPSPLVLPGDQNFSTVSFPPCDDFALDTGCKYEPHTLQKLYSTVLKIGAKPAFEAFHNVLFNQTEYKELLLQYRTAFNGSHNSSAAVREVACKWLNENKFQRSTWSSNHRINEKTKLFIAGIFPLHAKGKMASHDVTSIVRAAEQGQNDVNKNKNILKDYELMLYSNDGRCEADYVLKAFIDNVMSVTRGGYSKLVGILGPACSNTLEPLVGVTQHYRTIVISYSAEGSSFSDRKKYPYFFRTIGENNQYQQVYLQLFKKLGWSRLAALSEDGQKYTEYLTHLELLLKNNNFSLVMNHKFPAEKRKRSMEVYLNEMKKKSVRIIIGDMYDDVAREMMCQAYKLQMTANESYVWFLPSWLSDDWYNTTRYNEGLEPADQVPCTTEQMVQAINGHLSLSHAAWAHNDSIMQTNQTVGEWKENLYKLHNLTSLSSYAGYAYDAVWMFALALDKLAEDPKAMEGLHDNSTTNRLVALLEKTNFNGVSGHIQFRGPSRVSVVEVRQWVNYEIHVVGRFEPNISSTNNESLTGTLNMNESSIRWLNLGNVKPKDGTVFQTDCYMGLPKYFGIDCDYFIIICNVIVICIVVVILGTGFLIVRNRYNEKWKKTEKIMKYYNIELESLEKWEIPPEKVVINRKLGEGAFGYVYGGEALFDSKGWVAVAVKTLKVGSTPEEKLEFLCEAEVMKRFDHANIVQLLGVCTKNEPVYTVMEFMLYGDLKTFLLARRHLVNEKVGKEADEISSTKLTHMSLDVARALSYLAELKFVHRDVACRNCLVNAARVVKLGDFGMTRPMFDKDYYKFSRKGMLPVRWMSPESLEQGLFTPASDVWSFGVLLFEIITFGSFPFQGLSNNEVLEHVKAGNTLQIPPRVKPQAEALIRSCWAIDHKKRPKASEIVEYIANNPRLLQPCLDVPLASVQMDDSQSVDLLEPERQRNFSFSLRNRKSSGVFNSPSQWDSNCNGVGTPSLWLQEVAEPEPTLEEEGLDCGKPLLNRAVPNKYIKVMPSNPTAAHQYSAYNSTQEDILL